MANPQSGGRRFRWAVVGVATLAGGAVALANLSRPMVQASSFWPESVPELSRQADLVVRGRVGDLVGRYRVGATGEVGGDPGDDGVAGVVYEFLVDEVIGGDFAGKVVYVTYLDPAAYPGTVPIPQEAILFLRREQLDPGPAKELGEYLGDLFTPLGSQGVFRVKSDVAVSLSAEEAASLGGDLLTIPMSDLDTAVRTAFAVGGE